MFNNVKYNNDEINKPISYSESLRNTYLSCTSHFVIFFKHKKDVSLTFDASF